VTPSDLLTPTSPPRKTGGEQHAEKAPRKNRKRIERKLEKAKECILSAEDGISLERAVAILDRLRRAYREWDAARRELLDGLLPLVRDAVPDLWGALWIGLATAIDRLTRNEESDLLKYVVEEMERSEREFWCEESGHIYPPASTNSTRKRRGKAPHPALHRQAGNIDDSEGLSQGKRTIDRKGRPETHWFTIPIKLPTTPDHEEEKWRPSQIVKSDDERRVLALLIAGFTQPEIAKRAGMKLYRVRKIRETLQERMRRLEAEEKRPS
jgi:DNA-binding CsgD family transcriptional regulator